MKIIVLNGSPKGDLSVTMQYVHLLAGYFPQHTFDIIHVAQHLPKIEREEALHGEIIERIRAADGVLWAFPLYYMLVHGNYKRFIELIWERGVQDAFAGKYTASLSTSIHFYDHTAHNYVQAVCDDLDMRYVGAFSAEMQDMLDARGRDQLRVFARTFISAIENKAPTLKTYAPLTGSTIDYTPDAPRPPIDAHGKKIVLLTDAEPHQTNLLRMIDRFAASLAQEIETINLRDLEIKGGCLGCLRCGYDNRCVYQGRDDYIDFFNTRLKTAEVIVFAGAIRDRYLSAMWKTFFDRSFFNTHTPSLRGKQFGLIISGPLSQIPNLRQVLRAWIEIQQSNLAGIVTDESGHTDDLIHALAANLIHYAGLGYVQPHTFLGLGGRKIFRDDIWGRLRIVFYADHRAYKRLGIYDFPQRDWRTRIMNALIPPLLKIPRFRQEFTRRIKRGMIQPYQKILSANAEK